MFAPDDDESSEDVKNEGGKGTLRMNREKGDEVTMPS